MTSIVVVSPTTSSNALGRALSLVDLARQVDPSTRVYGPRDGEPWVGAAQHDVEVRRFTRERSVLGEVEALTPPVVVWVVKPMRRSWHLAERLSRRGRTTTVLDLDDHDEALSEEFRALSLANRLRLPPWRMLNPSRIRQTRRAAVRAAQGFTYSSEALARELDVPDSMPRLRVPHPRPEAGILPARPEDGRIHAGCLGTLRPHKGLSALGRLVERDSSLVLHVFDPPPKSLARFGGQVVAHPPAAPLRDLYAMLDVSLLPQGASRGSGLQLPAKLLDSLRFGVPALATPTAAIEEIAAGAYCPVTDWEEVDDVLERMRRCASERDRLGGQARARFERDLSIEAQAEPFAAFIAAATRVPERSRGVPTT